MTGIQPLFRFATPEDLPGIGKLWLEETEWGALPPEFAQLFALAPGGAPRTLVAVDQSDGTILGQCGFVPTTIKAGEQLIKGVRPHSTIVSKAYSAAVKTFDLTVQPAAAMYVNGLRLLRDDGCKLAYMVPHPRWAPLFRLQPRTEITSFPLHSVALPVPASLQLPAGCTASPVETWDKSIDDLSERWSPQYECGLVRTAEVLAWKASIGYYRSLAVRQGDELVGVVVIRTKGDRMWQICDMLTADAGETLRCTLIAAILDGAAHGEVEGLPPEKRMRKVSILATPLMRGALDQLGFIRDDWNFPLVVERLDDSLSADEVAPQKWYVAAND